jgi:hypothetical protein
VTFIPDARVAPVIELRRSLPEADPANGGPGSEAANFLSRGDLIMRAIRNLATLAAAAMLAVAFSPARANAQGVVQGTFKLPFQARWGTASLASGSYRFEISGPEGAGDAVREVEVRVWSRTRKKSQVFILGQVDGGASPTKANALLCVSRRSTCVVRTLQLGVAGETISFPMRRRRNLEAEKRNRKTRTLQAKAHDHVQRVPITLSGK